MSNISPLLPSSESLLSVIVHLLFLLIDSTLLTVAKSLLFDIIRWILFDLFVGVVTVLALLRAFVLFLDVELIKLFWGMFSICFKNSLKESWCCFSACYISFILGLGGLLVFLPADIDSYQITILDFIRRSANVHSLINIINAGTDTDDDLGTLVCTDSELVTFVIWEGNWCIELGTPGLCVFLLQCHSVILFMHIWIKWEMKYLIQ